MIDLDLLKKQLYIVGDHEDNLLTMYRDNAIAFIEHHCDRKIVSTDTDKPEEMKLDGVITQAILQLVGMFYRDREDQPLGEGGAPYKSVIDRLLWTKKRF